MQWSRRGLSDMQKRAAFTIRPARIDDVDSLSALGRQLNESQGDPTEHFVPAVVREHVFGSRPRIRVFVADINGEVAGYASHTPSYESGWAAPGYYLCDLFVARPYRRRGIARALVAAVANRAKAEGCVYLWWASTPRNREAHAFCGSLGATKEVILAHALIAEEFDKLSAEYQGASSVPPRNWR
jgi:GNAT superfamily N-acetyltransferase